MNNPSVIGFFLALLFNCPGNENFLGKTPWEKGYRSSYVPTAALGFVPGLLQGNQLAGSTDDSSLEMGNRLFLLYGGIVFVLAMWLSFLLCQLTGKHGDTKRLRMLEAERSVLFNNAPCGYHATDENGIIVSINDTLLRWLGYERSDVIGKMKFVEIVDVDSEKARDRIIAIEKNKPGKTELTLIRKSGDPLPVILSIVNVEGLPQGQRLYSTIDNSKCHEAMQRIKSLDQELEAFSYSISHDLRAPLRSIDGYSKILQEDYADKLDEEGRRVLNVVMNNARRMGKLIDDLLDFGRLGRKSLLHTQVEMTSLVKHILGELVSQELGRNIKVKVGALLPCWADADMIRQVWSNLLENAVKYTGKKETSFIEVTSYPLGEKEICYEVKDNGVGFDMQYGGKLFGIFQRLHKMQDFSGTGVGLAIVKRIVTRHGGRVWAEASLNDGATFYFTLPTQDENA